MSTHNCCMRVNQTNFWFQTFLHSRIEVLPTTLHAHVFCFQQYGDSACTYTLIFQNCCCHLDAPDASVSSIIAATGCYSFSCSGELSSFDRTSISSLLFLVQILTSRPCSDSSYYVAWTIWVKPLCNTDWFLFVISSSLNFVTASLNSFFHIYVHKGSPLPFFPWNCNCITGCQSTMLTIVFWLIT